jgi:cyanophycin synthetase
MKAPSKEDFVEKILKGKTISVFTWEFVRAAIELDLQYKFFTPPYEDIEKYVEISDGKKSYRFIKAMFPLNDVVSAVIAKKKPVTNFMLAEAGLPVPKQIIVKGLDDPKIKGLKFPVVVKPQNLTGGEGITANIKDEKELKLAFKEALDSLSGEKMSESGDEAHPEIIIEEMIKGLDHRILVLDGQVIAAIRKNPAEIIADSYNTIAQLIEAENATEIRTSKQISSIKIDNDLINTLKEQGFKLDSVPTEGTRIKLHYVSNLSRGSTTENVTDIIHPKFKEMAIKATEVTGLRLAGVDFMAEDISKDPTGQAHGILEVNAHPGSRLHLHPTIGEAVDVTQLILKYIFNIK